MAASSANPTKSPERPTNHSMNASGGQPFASDYPFGRRRVIDHVIRHRKSSRRFLPRWFCLDEFDRLHPPNSGTSLWTVFWRIGSRRCVSKTPSPPLTTPTLLIGSTTRTSGSRMTPDGCHSTPRYLTNLRGNRIATMPYEQTKMARIALARAMDDAARHLGGYNQRTLWPQLRRLLSPFPRVALFLAGDGLRLVLAYVGDKRRHAHRQE